MVIQSSWRDAKVVMLLAVIALMVSAYSVGSAGSFLVTTLLFWLLAVLSVLIVSRTHDLRHGVPRIFGALAFSYASFVLALAFMPFVTLWGEAMSIFLIQYLYLFPVVVLAILVFMLSSRCIADRDLQVGRLALMAVSGGLGIMLLVSAGLFVWIDRTVADEVERFDVMMQESLDRIELAYAKVPEGDLMVLHQLREHGLSLEEEFERYREASEGNVCLSGCDRSILDQIADVVESVVSVLFYEGFVTRAVELHGSFDADMVLAEYSSREAYEAYLAEEFVRAHMVGRRGGYGEIHRLDSRSFVSMIRWVGEDSPLMYGLARVVERSGPFEEVVEMQERIGEYTRQQGMYPDLWLALERGLAQDEQGESRILRYGLLIGWLDDPRTRIG